MFGAPLDFGAQGYLALLVLAPICAAIVGWWLGWRRQARESFGGLPRERPRTRLATVAAPAAIVGALVLAVFAAARPQYGERNAATQDRSLDVAIVLDVSNSMLATDTEPSRLGRAQEEIAAMTGRMQGDRVGLVIFAATPFRRAPLTSDLVALGTIVETVANDRVLVKPGSDLGGAVAAAQKMLVDGKAQTMAILVISDGEDHGITAGSAVAAARAAGIRVYTAGAGTAAGAPVLDTDANGVVTPRRDASGRVVLTKLDEPALRTLAAAGGGRYVALSGDGRPLSGLVPELNALATARTNARATPQPDERFQIFAALALTLAGGELLLPVLLRPGAGRRKLLRVLPLAGSAVFVAGVCTTSVAEINRRGNSDYAAGDYGGAISQYKTAEAIAPSRGELNYNAGNAYDQQGDYARAIEETKRALPGDPALASRLQYALGNHYVGAQQLLDALEAYKRALLADPSDADAKHNLEAVIARLSPTPAPSSTPTPVATPNADGTPDASQGTAQASATAGTASPNGNPAEGSPQLDDQQLQQALSDALKGIDQGVSTEEAQRILDLLDQQNRRAVDQLANNDGASGPPDY